MKPLVLITAPVATRSGYGSHSRDIVHSLLDMNKFDVRVMSVRWGSTSMNALNKNNPNDKRIIDILMSDDALERQPDVHIHIVVPNEFQQIGKYNIGITAGIETTGCVSDWIQGCNRMDLIIVPSEFTKKEILDTVFQ